MKKSVLSIAMLSVVLLAGCSNEEGSIGSENNDLIKVELGTKAPTIVTKAAVIANTTWNNLEVSVWGLSKNTESDWMIANNISLFPEGGIVGTINETEGTINLGEQTYYYPAVSTNNYTFYGYYPSGEATLSNNQLVMTYTLTGVEDVLCGKAVAGTLQTTPSYEGYNALYFRKGGATPSIDFKHMLTRFTFGIIAGEENASTIYVDSIRLTNVKNQVTLIVADKMEADNEGVLTATGMVDGTAIFRLNNADGTYATPVTAQYTNGTDVLSMGESIMIPAGETAYNVEIYVRNEDSSYKQTIVKEIKLDGMATFAAGSSYKVVMTVYGEKTVEVSATLEAWNEVEEPVDLGDLN